MRNVRALMLSIAMIALIIAGAGYLLLREIRAVSGSSSQAIEVTIDPGDTTAQIATKLRSAGLIRQPLLFIALVKLQGLDGKLQAGQYMLQPSMTMSDILIALQYNIVAAEVEFTIPEGMRLEEIADIIGSLKVVNSQDFLNAARKGASFRSHYPSLNSLPVDGSLEGYLFPDTYRIYETATVTDIIETMLKRFDQQYATIDTKANMPDVSIHEFVTMASIVQREAALESEMPRIAAVFWNRLKPENRAETGDGKLQADPTVQYALGYSDLERTWWRKNLTFTDLKIDTPYNTREYAGLPPGPICSPGIKALQAAREPDNSANYLYFVASCKKDGTHNFATNFVDFQQFESEYQKCSNQ